MRENNKIAVIDDDATSMKIIKGIIKKLSAGAEILEADNPFLAAFQIGRRPKTTILDYNLGRDYDCSMLIEAAELKSGKVIILSGSGAEEILQEHPEFSRFKIFNKSQVTEAVKEAVG